VKEGRQLNMKGIERERDVRSTSFLSKYFFSDKIGIDNWLKSNIITDIRPQPFFSSQTFQWLFLSKNLNKLYFQKNGLSRQQRTMGSASNGSFCFLATEKRKMDMMKKSWHFGILTLLEFGIFHSKFKFKSRLCLT
jgi:hypothetical protein